MPHRTWIALIVVVAMTVPLAAQRWRGLGYGAMVKYDGRFTIARIPYNGYPGWSFDWPEMEHNLGEILRSITAIPTMPDGNNIIPADDPELFRNPIAYISEPGYWYPTEPEVVALRAYLEKGGFLIVDDFHYDNEWAVFNHAIHRVLPDAADQAADARASDLQQLFSDQVAPSAVSGPAGRDGAHGRVLRDPQGQ